MLLAFLSFIPFSLAITKNYENNNIVEDLEAWREHRGTLYFEAENWKLITNFNLKIHLTEITEAINLTNKLQAVCNQMHQKTSYGNCKNIMQNLYNIINDIKVKENILTSLITHRRVRKSLFDGIGETFRTLFETLSMSDVQNYNNQFQSVYSKQKYSIDTINKQTFVIKTLHSLLNTTIVTNNENAININSSIQSLETK